MNNKKIFIGLIILIISIILTVVISMYLLNTKNIINQGAFRICDLVTESKILIDEKDTEKLEDMSSIIFDVFQTNKLTILFENKIDFTNIYINNIKATLPLKLGEFYITQNNYEEKFDLKKENLQININPSKIENQYKIELNINNDKCMKNVNVSSGSKQIRYDGTILNQLNTKINDLKFTISFDLNIIDQTGKVNTCKFKFNIPKDELYTNGICINRENINNLNFKIK